MGTVAHGRLRGMQLRVQGQRARWPDWDKNVHTAARHLPVVDAAHIPPELKRQMDGLFLSAEAHMNVARCKLHV